MAEYEARLLVVDDEPLIRDVLASSLKFAKFEVHTASNGEEALQKVTEVKPDLIVLDVMMPDMDGYSVTKTLRSRGINIPVLFVTAKDAESDIIEGFKAGGDDYVIKPFSLGEIVLRIKAILRRVSGTPEINEDDDTLRVADIVMNEDAHEVSRAGHSVELSPTEFKLLRYLMVNEGRVVSKSQILDHVWEYKWDGDAAIVESYISYLRRKLDVPGNCGEIIQTRRGVGYLMRNPL